MQLNSLQNTIRAAAVAALLLGLGPGCSNNDPAGPEGDPRLVNVRSAMEALIEEYGSVDPDFGFVLSMHSPSYRLVPAQPDSIPFLAPGAEWDFGWETEVLTRLLVPGRTTWIDQVLLEVDVLDRDTTGTRITWQADTELILLVGQTELRRSRSLIDWVYERDALGNHILVEQIESLFPLPVPPMTVGQLKSQVESPPAVETLDPTSVGINNAVLQAEFNPNGLDTSYWFEWGTDTSYGSVTPTVAMGDGTIDDVRESTLAALASSTTYHYRAVARSLWGTSHGENRSFTTLGP